MGFATAKLYGREQVIGAILKLVTAGKSVALVGHGTGWENGLTLGVGATDL